MHERTVCVMARMLDQEDGLYVYARNLLEGLLALDERSRYVILLRTEKRADLFDAFPNADVRVRARHRRQAAGVGALAGAA